MGNTTSASNTNESIYNLVITLTYEKIVINYHIYSTGLIEKKISSDDGREVIFHVDATTHEMVDLTNAHVGKDGNFDSCSAVVTKFIQTVVQRWAEVSVENLKDIIDNDEQYKWICEIKIPSESKTVDYTITSDNENLVKKVTCVATQKSTVFNVDLTGNTKMVDETPTGADGERDKLLEVLNKMCTTLVSY